MIRHVRKFDPFFLENNKSTKATHTCPNFLFTKISTFCSLCVCTVLSTVALIHLFYSIFHSFGLSGCGNRTPFFHSLFVIFLWCCVLFFKTFPLFAALLLFLSFFLPLFHSLPILFLSLSSGISSLPSPSFVRPYSSFPPPPSLRIYCLSLFEKLLTIMLSEPNNEKNS